jgi:hypothetical protein
MRIDFTQGGGLGYFPGLNKPVELFLNKKEPSSTAQHRYQ